MEDTLLIYICIFFFVDMINMMKIGYEPGQCEWIYSRGAAIAALAW